MLEKKIVALLTDFGTSGHFAGTMKGVILQVDPTLRIFDISHDIQPQNILEAAYTLADTASYWPENTVFVAVVDPGVGTLRRSIAVKTGSGQIIVAPDNGILTLIARDQDILQVRVIPEDENRLPGSREYYTFHGRDVYAYNAARIAAGLVDLGTLGLPGEPEGIEFLVLNDARYEDRKIKGNVVKIEKPFGNLCTDISGILLKEAGIGYGERIGYQISESGKKRLQGTLPIVKTFGDVPPYEALAYIDSSGRLGLSVNQGNFSDFFQVQAGLSWHITLWKK